MTELKDTETLFGDLKLVIPSKDDEWEAVRNFRQKYFFGRVPMDDPYTWTFNHADHVHFLFYENTQMIGYAHIQLWPENRAALWIIVIDEHNRNQGKGSKFLTLCENWLIDRNIKTLLLLSSPAAYQFYCHNDYIEMPFNAPDGYKGDPQDIAMGKNLRSIKNNQ